MNIGIENPNCDRCQLNEFTNSDRRSVCLKGEGGDSAKLLILMDAPTIVEDKRHRGFVSDGAEYLKFLMKRMSVDRADYYLDYVLKCYPKACKQIGTKAHRQQMLEACSHYTIATLQLLKPKAIVLMGRVACEAAMGSDEIGSFEGTFWVPKQPLFREHVSHVWITYNPAYGLQDPSESVGIYRTILAAASEAKLKPKFNDKVSFDYGY